MTIIVFSWWTNGKKKDAIVTKYTLTIKRFVKCVNVQ